MVQCNLQCLLRHVIKVAARFAVVCKGSQHQVYTKIAGMGLMMPMGSASNQQVYTTVVVNT